MDYQERIFDESSDDSDLLNDEEDDVICFSEALLQVFGLPESRTRIANYVRDVVRNYSDEEFRQHFRLRRDICYNVISGFAESEWSTAQEGLGGAPRKSPEEQVLAFIWYAANKTTIRAVGDRFNMSGATVEAVFERVMSYLCASAPRVIQFPADLQDLAEKFKEVSGMPGVIGCIDGCYIPIRCPAHKIPSTYVNRHDMLSVTLQGVCDNSRRFLDISSGYPSKIHDARVFDLSDISRRLPSVCEQNRYHLLGDAAYPLREYLITPYKDYGNLSEQQVQFNFVHSSTRVLIENTFGILKQCFRQLKGVELFTVEKVCRLITSCCVLHNICIDEGDILDNEDNTHSDNEADTYVEANVRDTALRVLGEQKR
ncbi:putative nuclease HARBI1 [Ornithodoros turicata]|uniref:putative nuclease HARBI1 n=1 Tax=Ornithodoros turicata TaxID=34597 RepID=UPI003138F382